MLRPAYSSTLLSASAAGVILLAWFGATAESGGPPRSQAASDIYVPEGFIIDIAADSTHLDYPMFATMDEHGRLFVFESTGNVYETSEEALEDPQFRIKMLEDVDDDGLFDRSTVFADNVGFPQGGVFYRGSLYASSAPDLLKLTDTNGDGVADEREVILSGWVLNVNANSLIGPFMGPDGWLYLTSAIEGFDVTTKEGVRLKGETSRIWRVRPDGSGLEWISAGGMNNPVELTFTNAGEPIGTETYFTDPKAGQRDALVYWTEGGVYPKPNSNIARDGLVRTGGLMPVVSKYSRVSPAGVHRYLHTALGENFGGNLFSAQFNTHRVLRHRLYRDGGSFRTKDEVFLWSDDEDFHPTDVLEDADGSLLIVETGGWFIKGCPLSQVSKPELKGAIYRVRREGAAQLDDPYGRQIPWRELSASRAASYMEDPRPFIRNRAVESLVEEGAAAVDALNNVLRTSASAGTRARAVFALYRIGTPEARATVRTALGDVDISVRVAAARAVGLARDADALPHLAEMVHVDEPAARRQAATALGQIGDGAAVSDLLRAAEHLDDRFFEHAVIYALISLDRPDLIEAGLTHASAGVQKATLVALDQTSASSLTARQVMPFLSSSDADLRRTALWVAAHHPDWADELSAHLQDRFDEPAPLSDEDGELFGDILVSFCADSGIQRFIAREMRHTSIERRMLLLGTMAECQSEEFPQVWMEPLSHELGSNEPIVQARVLDLVRLRGIRTLRGRIRDLAGDSAASADLRIQALGVLLQERPVLTDREFAFLVHQMRADNEAPLRRQAAATLANAHLTDDQLRTLAAEYLPTADAFILTVIVPVFAGPHSAEVGRALVSALAASQSLEGFTTEHLTALFAEYPKEIRPSVDRLLHKVRAARASRLQRIEALERLLPDGDIERGRALFFGKAICSTCHTIGTEGGSFGPDLTSIQRDRSVHDLLEATLYPGVSFVREYETYRIRTKDGEHVGIIREQTPASILLATGPEASLLVRRSDVEAIDLIDQSMMPQGLDRLMTDDEMADLMAFLLGQDQDPETDAAILR